MKVLSTFNGISCGRVAFEKAGIPVEVYTSFEIDEDANVVAKFNYPNDDYRGDVFAADFTEFKGYDILIGGSPCTYWSIAQTNGRETKAEGMGWELFKNYLIAKEKFKPDFFKNFSLCALFSSFTRCNVTRNKGFEFS